MCATPRRWRRRRMEIAGPAVSFRTVPFSYPHHRDPIDTMFRPSPEALAALFRPAVMVRSEIIDVGGSYRGQVSGGPGILLRHVFRFPFPFIGFGGWKRSMRKLYWLFNNYRITGAVFKVPTAAAPPKGGPR